MPSRLQIDYDVNRAMFEVLVPALIAEDEYSIRRTPSSWNPSPERWANQLLNIHDVLRRKYAPIIAEDIRVRAACSYDRPLADTRDSIVDEILRAGLWFPIG